MLTQEEIDEIVNELKEEYGKEYTDLLGENIMREDILSILDDVEMTDADKLDAIREYLESEIE